MVVVDLYMLTFLKLTGHMICFLLRGSGEESHLLTDRSILLLKEKFFKRAYLRHWPLVSAGIAGARGLFPYHVKLFPQQALVGLYFSEVESKEAHCQKCASKDTKRALRGRNKLRPVQRWDFHHSDETLIGSFILICFVSIHTPKSPNPPFWSQSNNLVLGFQATSTRFRAKL